jgi:hypothetical protein
MQRVLAWLCVVFGCSLRLLCRAFAPLAAAAVGGCAVAPEPAQQWNPGDFVAYNDADGVHCAKVWKVEEQSSGEYVFVINRLGAYALMLPGERVRSCR